MRGTTQEDTVTTARHEAEPRAKGARMPRRERRAQLLASALEVFVAHGYHSAAMDDIADRAGVSKPVLYQHFPGKLELYIALLDQSCEAVVNAIREALDSTSDNKQRVAAAIAAFYQYVGNETGAFRLVFESDLTNEPAVRERVDRVTDDCAAAIADIIAQDTGLPTEAAMLLSVGLVGMGQVSARFWLSNSNGAGTISQKNAAALVAALAWRGIGGYPKENTPH
jgi:AcrR family transcriptional regulator